MLDDVNLDLPAGAVVAIVGENGAGKTTLVKLLCKLYEPTAGAHPHRRPAARPHRAPTTGAPGWPARSRTSSASSSAPATRVGLGDVPRLDDEPAVVAAVDRAGADDVVERLAAGLDTQLGPTWPERRRGVASGSGRSWPSRAASCATHPLLLVLDEPTAALDAETEHALFERYAAAARDDDRRRPDHASWCRTASPPCGWPT